jgi:hypothetical protein
MTAVTIKRITDADRIADIKRRYPHWQDRPEHCEMIRRMEKRVMIAETGGNRVHNPA